MLENNSSCLFFSPLFSLNKKSLHLYNNCSCSKFYKLIKLLLDKWREFFSKFSKFHYKYDALCVDSSLLKC